MARSERKGTVTPLSSIVSAEEAKKASRLVAEKINEKKQELEFVNRFSAENTSLINLVQRLPDELHHEIMVPFGKAAFFPGRLIHTNEFLVLLGEGYYADRTSKQTVEILQRRGKAVNSQAASLKAMMHDLQAEASFFNSTSAEAEEGLLEVREEFIEEDSEQVATEAAHKQPEKPSTSATASMSKVCDDDEFDILMAKMNELEREENECEQPEADGDDLVYDSEDKGPQELDVDKLNMGDLSLQSSLQGETSFRKELQHQVMEKRSEQDSVPFETKMGIQAASTVKDKGYAEINEPDAASRTRRPVTQSFKAFTGSIVEHTHNLPTNLNPQPAQAPSSSQPTKPVSRFKLQRR